MSYFITLNGRTGVGKTIATDIFQKELDAKYIHPIFVMKEFFEKVLSLEPGALDTKEGKDFIPQGGEHSMHVVLQELYHCFKIYFPSYSIYDMKYGMKLAKTDNFIFTSIRNISEVNFLQDLQNSGMLHIHINIHRDVEPRTSDELVLEINETLTKSADITYDVYNVSTMEAFIKEIHQILNKIKLVLYS